MLQLRSPSHVVQTTSFSATGATTAKVPHLFNSRVWIPQNTALAASPNVFAYYSEVSGGVCLGGEAWTPGQDVYWDNTNTRFTVTVGTNTKCGKALVPKAAADVVTPLFLFDTFAP